MTGRRDEEFREFVGGAQRRLLRAADLLTGDRHRAADLVQHALLKAYLAWATVREGDPEAHVRSAMVNRYTDRWRRGVRRGRTHLPAPQEPAPGAVADQRARRAAVLAALSRLTERERAVVVLRYDVGLTEAEIARELGCPVGTVVSTAARAESKLRADRGAAHRGDLVTAPPDRSDRAVELGYADPLSGDVDIDTVIRRARRARARRWVVATAAGVAGLAVLGSVAVDRIDDTATIVETNQAAMARVMAQPFAREHPPAGRPVLVDAVPGWIVVAWISRAGEFCGGPAATVGGRAAPSALNCWLDTVAGAAPRVLSKPILQALPLPSDAGNSALAIGAVIGNAARVEVVFRGSAVLAPAVGIPTGRAAMVHAYAVWLPTSGTDTYRWSDITEVTARDAAGRIVAHLP